MRDPDDHTSIQPKDLGDRPIDGIDTGVETGLDEVEQGPEGSPTAPQI
jgi:hypothetical protein